VRAEHESSKVGVLLVLPIVVVGSQWPMLVTLVDPARTTPPTAVIALLELFVALSWGIYRFMRRGHGD
jgi:hypothetical protein